MENKYFTPSIEDIRIGYECEQKHTGTWVVVKADRVNQVNGLLYEFTQARMDGLHIRTPYLTKEQIHLEGWQIKNPSTIHGQTLQSRPQYNFFIEKGNYMGLILNDGRLELIYKDVLLDDRAESTSNGRLYLGECKDINTFRQIQKLLNIK